MKKTFFVLIIFLSTIIPHQVFSQKQYQAHGRAMHGNPKYSSNFPHFDYVNPAAPKGGKIVQGAFGTYDNLNPFILKGRSAAGLGNLFETLMANSHDEAFTEYCLLWIYSKK